MTIKSISYLVPIVQALFSLGLDGDVLNVHQSLFIYHSLKSITILKYSIVTASANSEASVLGSELFEERHRSSELQCQLDSTSARLTASERNFQQVNAHVSRSDDNTIIILIASIL